jgi:hypothetical protein
MIDPPIPLEIAAYGIEVLAAASAKKVRSCFMEQIPDTPAPLIANNDLEIPGTDLHQTLQI